MLLQSAQILVEWVLTRAHRMPHQREAGQGLVEYALILVLIAVVVIGILGTLGGQIDAVFQEISNAMGGVGGGGP